MWFDPWWRNSCIAHDEADIAIRQSGLTPSAKVSSVISNGTWRLPQNLNRTNRLSVSLTNWLSNFDFPELDVSSNDCILWNDHNLSKIKACHTWDVIRFKLPRITWFKWVRNKLSIARYAHLEWMVCLDRLPTLSRLASFGIDITTSCFLCAGGNEHLDHLFLNCPYSNHVLQNIAGRLRTTIAGNTWLELLDHWGSINHQGHRVLVLLAAQVFAYHIWRERNARSHDKGVSGPSTIITCILVDISSRICNSKWLSKQNCLDTFASWLV